MIKSEFELIHWIRQHTDTGDSHIEKGIGDDMAVLRLGEDRILITTDMLLEGVHFDLQHATLEQVGYKAMACSLSDCAAMASIPLAAVGAAALPQNWTMEKAEQLHAGIELAAKQYHCPLVGGDTTSWNNPLAINITMLSRMPRGKQPVLRSGATVGDILFVTGQLGGSLEGKHLHFTPRVTEALQLADMADLHAMMEISDGLAQDLGHICEESGVSAVLDADSIPISPAAAKKENPLHAALGDGEDFELLFCVSPSDADSLSRRWSTLSSLPLPRVGEITQPDSNHKVWLRRDDRTEPLTVKGWQHFRES